MNDGVAAAQDPRDPLLLDRQVCFPLYAATNLLSRLYGPVLRELGLTYPQYLVMLVLWEKEPQTVGSLGARLYLDSGTLTPLLKRMEAAGLVRRTRDPEDERRVVIELTESGKILRNQAVYVPKPSRGGANPKGLTNCGTACAGLSNCLRSKPARRGEASQQVSHVCEDCLSDLRGASTGTLGDSRATLRCSSFPLARPRK